ncbi:ankyrin repeat domain-containing protein [Streptomyces sp. NBC_00102]|uniref:ankyrin repeat domain-containing protein n=1 Tax=Streptomyces sp. NBC_00102 TaxID=2975652 RepID=UPI002253722E|nr:ankyrin repeat domain-containing protein [Streptomyces sp. NBC_00102]MCX5396781.1 ankyrin repeat domain-containing protein [Streptomyces sp. NBC_00102]
MKRRRSKKLSRDLVGGALTGDAARVLALLRVGADPGTADSDGTTPLYAAAVQGDAEAVRILLRAGADPDTESAGPGSEGTPLCAAACWGHTGVVRALLAAGAVPDLREDRGTGRTPLEWAMAGAWTETVAVLEGAAVDSASVK